MNRPNALTAKQLPRAEAREILASLVKEGKVSAKGAALIDLQREELTDAERANAARLAPLARQALERSEAARQAA